MSTLKRITPLFFCIISIYCYGQVPEDISLSPTGESISRACPDRNAGTVRLGAFTGQSNDVALDRSFFCLNDRLNIIHNGDAEVLDSDPNGGTTPGIGYAWYTCPPSVDRPDLDAILNDPCLLTDPTPNMGIYVYVDQIDGNALFSNGSQINGQSIPDFFNQGEPVEVWFAPITVDAVSNGEAVFEGSPAGPCVHANVNAAFSIVYLTPLSEQNARLIPDGNGGCLGSFVANGGLPQFDGSTYSITIEHTTMPGVMATLEGSDYSHGDEVTFSFTQPGTYRVTLEDGKSCSHSFEIDLLCTNPVVFNVESGSADMGNVVCFDVELEGFQNVGTVSFEFVWNSNVFEYVSNSGFQIPSDPLSQIVDIDSDQGALRALWIAQDLINGQSVPDGTIYFEVCLQAIGECGESTPLDLTGDIIVTDADGNDLTFFVNPGTATINSGTGAALADVCPDDGSRNGSILLQMCGGQAPYAVIYTGPNGGGGGNIAEQNGTQLLSDLPAGDYVFTVTDNNGTVFNLNVTVPPGDVHDVRIGVNDPSCSYSSDGTIGITTSPAGMYAIEWSTEEFNTDTIRNISNGQYAVTVTDQNGCSVIKSVTANTQALEVEATITNATCASAGDGSLIVNASGGTPFANNTYRYQWQGFPPVTAQSSALPNLMPGDYELTVRDSNSCVFTQTYTIEAMHEITITDIMVSEPPCFDEQEASLRVDVTTTNSGGSFYSFEWESNGMDVTSLFGVSSTFSSNINPIFAGRYDFTVTDLSLPANCFLDTFVVIEEPDPIVIELVEFDEATCSDGSDGRIRVIVSGGSDDPNADFIFQWDGPSTVNGVLTQTGLEAGPYELDVFQTINGQIVCSVDTIFMMTQESGPEILDIRVEDVSCGGGADGSLEVIYAPPGQTFDVFWEDGEGDNYTGDEITGLEAGVYYVTVEAMPGCVSVDSAIVGTGADIEIDSVVYDSPSCPTSSNGSITVFATGPGGTLNYMWDHPNGSDNPLLPSIPAGNYSVTITAQGSTCPPLVIDTLNLLPPEIFDVAFSNITGATCPGICDGMGTVTATGGTGTINYLWESGEISATAFALCAGDNFVVVSDDICSDSFTITVPSADGIEVTSRIVNPTCAGDTNGVIELTPSGGQSPFIFMWNDGGPSLGFRDNLSAGNYISTITDNRGCEKIDTFEIVQPDTLMAQVLASDLRQITCAGRDDGRAMVTVNGGTGTPSYTWQPAISQTEIAENLIPGNYSVTVTDMNGCTDTAAFTISEPQAIVFELGEQSSIACFGETASFTVDTAYSGTGGPFVYTVNNGVQHPIGEMVDLLGGQYVITVIDSSGCFSDTSITISQPAEFSIDIGDDISVSLGDSARLALQSLSGAFPIDSFIWSSSNGDLSCIFCPSPSMTPITDGTVMLVAIDSTGCVATDELLVFVDASRKVFIPNAFSPNDDGINEVFEVFTGFGVERILTMQIFDRWGGRLFEARNLPASSSGTGGWNGEINNGEYVNPGVYTYLIQIQFVDDVIINYTGEVTVLR